jgi:hypothetical protein
MHERTLLVICLAGRAPRDGVKRGLHRDQRPLHWKINSIVEVLNSFVFSLITASVKGMPEMSAMSYNTFLARLSRLRDVLVLPLPVFILLVFILFVKLRIVAHFYFLLFCNLRLQLFAFFE